MHVDWKFFWRQKNEGVDDPLRELATASGAPPLRGFGREADLSAPEPAALPADGRAAPSAGADWQVPPSPCTVLFRCPVVIKGLLQFVDRTDSASASSSATAKPSAKPLSAADEAAELDWERPFVHAFR